MRRTGFTLIELLAVLAIIALLSVILLPVFAQVRGRARAAACLSNMKQIGTAVMMYAQDNDEMIVPGNIGPNTFNPNYFDFLLDPYVRSKKVWTCPEAANATDLQPRDIGMNEAVAIPLGRTNNIYPPLSLAKIEFPADLIVMNDTLPNVWNGDSSVGTGSFGEVFQVCRASEPQAGLAPDRLTLQYVRHWGGANYTFADGHARWSKPIDTLIPYVLWFTNKPGVSVPPQNSKDCNAIAALRPPPSPN